MRRSEQPFKCTCSKQQVLGVFGIQEDGLLYFHVLIRKQSELKGQIYTTKDISVWCPVCHRWWHLKLDKNQPVKSEETLAPKSLRKNNQMS